MREGITLSAEDRGRLEAVVSDRNSPQKHVWRARIVLLAAEGLGTAAIIRQSGKSKNAVNRWRERFRAEGVSDAVVVSIALLDTAIDRKLAIHDEADAHDFIEKLTHQTRDDREGDRVVRDRVRLIWTVPTYGGRRWWFRCPRTYCKTTKLYLPNGGWHFWSRQAYGLGYACQREGRFDRLQRRAAKLNSQLGGDGWGTWDTPPAKPKWMRWRTYERKYERWEQVVEKADAEFTVRAARILKLL